MAAVAALIVCLPRPEVARFLLKLGLMSGYLPFGETGP